jgi:hypothetical protein
MRLLPTLILVLALGTACSGRADPGLPTAGAGSASTPSASASASATNDKVAFARCLRGHGWNVPDPSSGDDWLPRPSNAKQKQAMRACRDQLPDGGDGDGVPTAAELEQLREFALCMREHDIPMDDPQPNQMNGGKMAIHGRFEHMNKDQMLSDPGWRTALAACNDKLPATMGGK